MEISNVIGHGLDFQDEIELEDYIRKAVPPRYKYSFNVSVARAFKDRNQMSDYGDTSCLNEDRKLEFEKEVHEFLSWKADSQSLKLKELKFIDDIGMSKDVAAQLDFEKRHELEKIFPELSEFNILAFKGKATSTQRRALIFPQEFKYRKFMDCMVVFLNKYDSQMIDKLGSRIKVRFKGKYNLQMSDSTYRYFKDKMEATINKYKLTYRVKTPITKRIIEIEGGHEKVNDMRNCIKEIMNYLHPKPYSMNDPPFSKYDCFALKSDVGVQYISRLNNKFNNKAFGRYEYKTNRFLLRGDNTNRDLFMQMLTIWVQGFNTKVKTDFYPLTNPKGYFKNRIKAKEQAMKFDILIKHRPEERKIELYYHENTPEDDRTTQPHELARRKKEELKNLKHTFDHLFGLTPSCRDMSLNSSTKMMRDLRESNFQSPSKLPNLFQPH
jgi:hypothetical protein